MHNLNTCFNNLCRLKNNNYLVITKCLLVYSFVNIVLQKKIPNLKGFYWETF